MHQTFLTDELNHVFLPSGNAVINTALRVRQTDMCMCTVTSMSTKNIMVAYVGGGVNSEHIFKYSSTTAGCFTTK
jgi:putative effector of murein hydrolase LrgA (UPF0299 family)